MAGYGLMAKHKNKLITTAVILAVLASAWLFGGNDNTNKTVPQAAEAEAEAGTGTDVTAAGPYITEIDEPVESSVAISTAPAMTTAKGSLTADAPTAAPTETPAPDKDKYQTDAVPEGKPEPVEPQEVTVGDGELTVTISVRCDAILDNMNLLSREKYELVPSDGVIFPETDVIAYEGESVFNVLQREMRRAKIHMSFRNTPVYNSAYIEDINNLYEFDAGELSGWMYKVNGWFPNYGCSRYRLKHGDIIEWVFTCDLGRDVGEYSLTS